MDEVIYCKSARDRFIHEHLFFRDAKLREYFDKGLQKKFRARVKSKHASKTYEKFMYVFVTDIIRDIILKAVGEISSHMATSGDLVISGGEAFNMYACKTDRVVTSDIDAKFVPRMSVSPKFFGKLQGTKLIMWDKIGQVAKRLDTQVKRRIQSMRRKHAKIFNFMGIGFEPRGPWVTRRFHLIKKRKIRKDYKTSAGDVFIDVELFALDLNRVKYLSTKTGKVESTKIGGILDIPFMRPKEFGYEVVLSRQRGVKYRNLDTGKTVTDRKIFIASKEFLVEDIYLMHKLKLRPEKKEKDRQRLLKLSKLFVKGVKKDDSIEAIFKRVRSKIVRRRPATKKDGRVSMRKAAKVNPYKYEKYTTAPSKGRLSKHYVHGLKTTSSDMKVKGYGRSSGNKEFNLKTLRWKNVTDDSYVKNEANLRPKKRKKLPKKINVRRTLYGHKPRRNNWVSNAIINKAAAIPFVGLKR
jgi:hypothetical protein